MGLCWEKHLRCLINACFFGVGGGGASILTCTSGDFTPCTSVTAASSLRLRLSPTAPRRLPSGRTTASLINLHPPPPPSSSLLLLLALSLTVWPRWLHLHLSQREKSRRPRATHAAPAAAAAAASSPPLLLLWSVHLNYSRAETLTFFLFWSLRNCVYSCSQSAHCV